MVKKHESDPDLVNWPAPESNVTPISAAAPAPQNPIEDKVPEVTASTPPNGDGGGGDGRGSKGPGIRKFNLDKLRLSADYAAMTAVKKQALVVQIRKPHAQEWVQFHPSETHRVSVAAMVWKEEREPYYIVDSDIQPNVKEAVPLLLVETINTQGNVFFTPIRLPGPDGKHNDWHRSLLDAAELGMRGWVRIVANQGIGGYDVYTPLGEYGPPAWPETPLEELLEIALRGRVIDEMNHPILRRLRGQG